MAQKQQPSGFRTFHKESAVADMFVTDLLTVPLIKRDDDDDEPDLNVSRFALLITFWVIFGFSLSAATTHLAHAQAFIAKDVAGASIMIAMAIAIALSGNVKLRQVMGLGIIAVVFGLIISLVPMHLMNASTERILVGIIVLVMMFGAMVAIFPDDVAAVMGLILVVITLITGLVLSSIGLRTGMWWIDMFTRADTIFLCLGALLTGMPIIWSAIVLGKRHRNAIAVSFAIYLFPLELCLVLLNAIMKEE